MTNDLNQFEYKEAKAGEILYNTALVGNILLFVSSGRLIISNANAIPVAEVDEGYFILLPAEKCHIATAITSVQTVLMYAGDLSQMITEDPEWDPDKPVVLPIFPSMARTIFLIEAFEKKKRARLN